MDPSPLLEPIRALHDTIRDVVVTACAREAAEELAIVDAEDRSDTIYRIDRVSENMLLAGLEVVARAEPLCLVAEGLTQEVLTLPAGATESDCRWRVIVDPIDGTREIMYQKRSAWVLTGVAPNRGADTRLRDIVLAVQTEIPILKQNLSDQLWAIRGQGAHAVRIDRLTGSRRPLSLAPSRAESIAHGFASVSRFFPGARDVLAAVDDEIVTEVLGPMAPGRAVCFEDQYLSTGGQFYELMMGHDRFIADLRPLLRPICAQRGFSPPLTCHPYDVSTALIAEELGVILTDGAGRPLDAPLDVDSDVSWAGYANAKIRHRVEPALHAALHRRGLLPVQ